jgi:phosphatidylserine/phosphatidylglycerophosphate/cardiolipin synthase-like enzyme
MFDDPPLQPTLHPWPLWLKRIALLVGLAGIVLALGLAFGTARRPPPRLLLSGPGHEWEHARALERLIATAHERISLTMFVIRLDDSDGPVRSLLQALADAAGRGVAVNVLLDRGTDRTTGQPDDKHADAAAWLRGHGVQVRLDELDRTTHAKVLVVDGRYCVIGSHNWTRSALTGNREASVLIDDPAIASQLEAWVAEAP